MKNNLFLKGTTEARIMADQEPTSFNFNDKDNNPILTLMANGDILVKGKFVENDKEVVDGLREFLQTHVTRRYYE